MFIRWWNLIAHCTYDFTEHTVLNSLSGNQRHITGTDHMRRIRQTVTVIKMCIGAAKFCCLGIHHIDKFLIITAAYMFCHCIGTLIGRFQHDTIQTLLQCHFLIQISGNMGRTALIFIYSCRRKMHHFVEIAIFQCQQCRHDLGNTCRITRRVCILFI